MSSKRPEKHGLFPVYTVQDATCNIIAIHGLGGDAFSTWTDKKGHMWLRDSLPQDVPQTSVWTYGYDAAIAFSRSTSGINDFALDLLERLLDLHNSWQPVSRNFVFICHSLGGIVAKKALTIVSRLETYCLLAPLIRGIVFLGTPHKGSRMTSFAKPLSRIANALIPTHPLRSDLLHDLSVLSQNLSEIALESAHALNGLIIVSFYEQKRMWPLSAMINQRIQLISDKVVEPASAILSLVNERAIPINADHREMVRFSAEKPEKYRPVRNALKDVIEKCRAGSFHEKGVQEYLRGLYCIDYETVLIRSPKPWTGTSNWIFHKDGFTMWAKDSKSSILWLRGDAGYGKTVIARNFVENLKLQTDRVTHLYPFGANFSYYFFRDELSDSTSELAFLRSILHQFLLKHPVTHSVINYHKEKENPTGKPQNQITFTRGWLWAALEGVLSLDILKNSLIVLDALDEAAGDDLPGIVQQLMKMISSLNQNRPSHGIKIIATSRFNYQLQKSFSHTTAKLLEIGKSQTSIDLELYIKEAVAEFGKEHKFPSESVTKIQEAIVTKAEGMFLWAHLAWERFQEGVAIWTRRAIEAKIKAFGELPQGLEGLYEKMIMDLDEASLRQLGPVFGIICVAVRSLNCEEIAALLAIESTHRNVTEIDAPFSIAISLQKLCPHLLKVDDEEMVTFVHTSMKRFCMSKLLGSRHSYSQRYLAQQILRYFSFDDFKKTADKDWRHHRRGSCLLKEKFVLYDYGAKNLKYHLCQVPFSDPVWIDYSCIVRNYRVFYAIDDPKHGASDGHCRWNDPPFFHGETPLRFVLRLNRGDTYAIVKAFVDKGYDINEKAAAESGGWLCMAALHYYIYAGNTSMASLLIELGASPNATDSLGRTALHIAILRRSDITEKLLALPGIDLNPRDAEGRTPLHYQASTSSNPWLLNDPRVDVTINDKLGTTAMGRAALWGDSKTFKAFLDTPNFKFGDHIGMISPLICAAQQQWKEFCKTLLLEAENIDLHCGFDGKSIVHWAVINDWKDLLEAALWGSRTQVNAVDKSGKTALHYAAKYGFLKMIHPLLQYGASVDLQDNQGYTAVHVAAIEGYVDVLIAILEESDYDVNQEDHQKRTLVHWAASCDSRSVMATVMKLPGVNMQKRDNDGRKPLHVAALCGCPNVLQLLLEQNVYNILQLDGFGNSALHLAARGQSLWTVEILIPLFDSRNEIVNHWGQTPLDIAAVYASIEVVDLLDKAGFEFRTACDPRFDTPSREMPPIGDEYTPTPENMQLVVSSVVETQEAANRQ